MRDVGEDAGLGEVDAATHPAQAMLEYALVLLMVTVVTLVAAAALGAAVARLLSRAIIRL